MNVSEIGEFGLIETIRKLVSAEETPPQLLIGIGDDAAAWRTVEGVEVATTDAMVEGVHFDLRKISWRELGWKSLAINISDIAAMGGRPRYALVSLCLPKDCQVESIAQLYQGMIELARKQSTAIVGGNVSASPVNVISITVIGTMADGGSNLLTRSSARAGDKVAVTGYLGSSAAGLKMLSGSLKLDAATSDYLRRAHFLPEPRVKEGQVLSANGIRTAIDISDGLLSDLGQVCKASGKAARVFADRLPIHPLVRKSFQGEALDLALTGGEDYELLFTGPQQAVEKVKPLLGLPVTIVGEITEGPAGTVLIDDAGKEIPYSHKGWEHFVSR